VFLISFQFFYVQCLFLSFCVLLVPGFVFVHGFPFVLNCTSVVFPSLFSRLDFDEFVFYLSCLASLVFISKFCFVRLFFFFSFFCFLIYLIFLLFFFNYILYYLITSIGHSQSESKLQNYS
jgi:hypothetical protein